MEIRVIPAVPKERRNKNSGKYLRVAAYARVSTDHEEQESSYEAQVAHFTEYIHGHADWTLAGIYADEGISATSTAKRDDFLRLIQDCEDRKIDLVLTKSISRWARNTLDSLQYIRRLKTLGIPVIFEKEGVNTMETSGELLITILSSIAQQESKSISDNVRLGIQYGFQRGKPMVNTTHFLGYTKDENGSLIIVPDQADLVRRLFRLYIDGETVSSIVRLLNAEGIPTPTGKAAWHDSTVSSMLHNEKYQGDLLLQKSYTVDFLEKKRAPNDGDLPQYYVEAAHDPIVPRAVFSMAQEKPVSRQMVCGLCGRPYFRDKTRGRWRHPTGGVLCPGKAISTDELEKAVMSAVNRLPEYEDFLRKQPGVKTDPGEEIFPEDKQRAEERRTIGSDEWLRTIGDKPIIPASSPEGEIAEKRIAAVHSALYLIAAMLGHPPEPYSPPEPASRDLIDFYRRTEYPILSGLMDRYDSRIVKKYISQVSVRGEKIEIVFCCGIRIVVER